MDFLGSIIESMEAARPPTAVTDEQRNQRKSKFILFHPYNLDKKMSNCTQLRIRIKKM